MKEDKILKHTLDDNIGLFKQCMALMNQCQDVEKHLEEAKEEIAKLKQCLLCGSADAIECFYDAEEHGIEIPLYLCLKCFDESNVPPIKMREGKSE